MTTANATTTTTGAPAAPAAPAKMVTLKIDGQSVTVPQGTSVYDAARQAGIYIPVLCHKENLAPVGVCRACVCEVKGARVYAASCMRAVEDNMEVSTTNPKLDQARATVVELLLSDHPAPCAKHKEDRSCELEIIAEKLGLREPIYTPRASSKGTDFSNPSIAIDHSACILCDRCVRACTDVAHNDVIGRMGKGYGSSISFDNNRPMGTSSCVNCGECMIHCPTGAITYAGGAPPKMEGAKLDAKDIQAIPLFKGINREFLRRSEGAVAVRQYNKGDVICRQGEFGSSAFYVDAGSVSIYIEGSDSFGHVRTQREGGFFTRVKSMLMSREQDTRKEEGQKRYIPIDASSVDLSYDNPLATVGEGELIGEAACLNYQPRSATVVAAEDGTIVFEMLRNVLDILRRNREFKRQMEAKYRERALENHLRSVAVFHDLPTDFIDYLRNKVELVGFNPGEMICRQGDTADAFYLVRMGHVKVYESFADGQGLVLTYLSRSQYFGEIGLLGGGARTANCSALDHVECVKIGRSEFDEMVEKFPQIRERLQAEANTRIEQNRQRITQLSRVSLPQYINQGLYQAQSLLILDLEKCTRCDECVRACAQAHDNVTRLVREGLRFDKYLVTTSCRSCRDPYCMVGCPVGSIRRKGDMQILIEDHCIGCGRCAEQCPYGNINMHPFTMNFTDLVTGEKKTREGRKAAVCDLCDDQCLGENDEPSCVYACPHDAAHRVDGQTFFDDLVRGSGGPTA